MRFTHGNLFLDHNITFRLFCFFLSLLSSCLYGETHFIFITGGSASGKTTFAKKLSQGLGETRTCYLSLDDYLDKRVQPKRYFIDGVPNFDHPTMINWPLLLQDLDRLQKGQKIDVPVYDFFCWMPTSFKQMDWKPIVIIEGIHAGQKQLDSIPGLRIFLHIPEELQYKRRIERDMTERGYSLEMSKKFFFSIALPLQKTFVDSALDKAHIVIEQSDGQDYLEKTVSYVIKTFEKYQTTGYDRLKIFLQYDRNTLIEKNTEEIPHESQ